MKRAINRYTGKPFYYNDTVIKDGVKIPARITKQKVTFLTCDKVDIKTLKELNGWTNERRQKK